MTMKLKSRVFFVQFIGVVSVCFLILWILRYDSGGTVPNVRLRWTGQSCNSLLSRVRVSANFTVNDIFDRLKLSMGYGGLQAQDIYDRPSAKQAGEKIKEAAAKEPLQIIIIPHSHNDPGWLKTYGQYFNEDTTHILSNAVEKLNKYRDMTFVWVETSFLRTWWRNQTDETRSKFKDIVKRGQLEMVSGSFVAPDEASPHYFALVDQLVEGHYWVKHNLDVLPNTSLSFDQFGYSASIPYLWKQSGLNNVLIKRVHKGVKLMMGDKHWMTFTWRQFWDPKGVHDIFAQVDTYEWMSISDSCGPDRHICSALDFSVQPDLPDPGTPAAKQNFVVERRSQHKAKSLNDLAEQIVDQYNKKAANYKQRVLLVPHGGDFHYAKADHWDRQYLNMKKFMNYVNSKKEFNVKMRFGTFNDYFQELHAERERKNLNFPVISGDFFTYTEGTEYWTGYFTTRQFDKRLGRELQESLRAAELLVSVAFAHSRKQKKGIGEEMETSILSKLSEARENLGIFQHHDAITGTSRAHVSADYEMRLSSSFTATQEVISAAIEYLVQDGHHGSTFNVVKPTLTRVDHRTLTKREVMAVDPAGTKVILVNTLTQYRHEIVRVAIDSGNVKVLDPLGKEVQFDILVDNQAVVEIAFEVNFPPVSVLIFTLQPNTEQQSHATQSAVTRKASPGESIICENQYLKVEFSGETGSPVSYCDKRKQVCTSLSLTWQFYLGRGGAYTMLSHGKEAAASRTAPEVTVKTSSKICQVSAKYDFFESTITLSNTTGMGASALRIDIYDDMKKQYESGDLALRLVSEVHNNRTFYVDSNGFQMMGRKFRSSLTFDGNVYPMTSMAFIEDSDTRLIVHSAQPHGIVSPHSGELDIMIDRVAPRSEMGMPEGVTDQKPTRTILFLEVQFNGDFESSHTKELGVPSLNSVYLNDLVQHPIYTFYSTDAMQNSKSSHIFLHTPLACDLILANVKNLASDDQKSEGLSLTFHRRGVSCNPSLEDQCPLNQSPYVRPGRFLKFYSHDTVRHMSLSHLIQHSSLAPEAETSLQPMEMKTFWLG